MGRYNTVAYKNPFLTIIETLCEVTECKKIMSQFCLLAENDGTLKITQARPHTTEISDKDPS